ncbi:MAG: DEAD/DEAH box helicase, partial [Phycisphaerales bacterium]
MTGTILPGTEVAARGMRWEVVTVESLGGQVLYRLRGVDGVVQGREIDLLHPFESIDPIIRELQPQRAAPLRNWLVYHQAFLLEQALGPGALLASQPGRLQIQPYQLVPVLRAIRVSRVRLLLADGVGLGKTIEAGLLITELMARRIVHRLLIVSPAGPLLEQWQTEMLERFGLRLDVIDRARLEEIRRSTERGANPFDHIPLGLTSMDFLKQERVLEHIDRTSYDIIVIDEAHNCADAGATQDREDSQRRRLAQVLARRCDALVLATATPHDGHDRSFASLCELLDPSLVDGRGVLRGEQFRQHVVRRLKRHIKHPDDPSKSLFKERQVEPHPVKPSRSQNAKFMDLHRELLELIAPLLRQAFRARRYSDVLSFIALLKRSVSTVAAFKATLNAVADRFTTALRGDSESQESRRQRLRTLREYHRKLARFGSVGHDEEAEHHLLEAEDVAQQLAELERSVRRGSRQLAKVASVVDSLETLVELAEEAVDQDPKLDALAAQIQKIRQGEPRANILVYTEYTDSQDAAEKYLESRGFKHILTMCGDDDAKTRSKVTKQFRTRDDLILISTDAAAEGLNLHQRCHHLIHLELPFNPNRLEQRNGRIDRYGQEHDPIVSYLYLCGTFEERILLRLIAKYERQRKRLTFVPNTLGVTTATDVGTERLLKGIMDEDTKLFREEGTLFTFASEDENEGADESVAELLEEIDRSLKGYADAAKSRDWLGESGLNAEQKLVDQADQAHDAGDRAGTVELAQFVRDAVLLEGGDVVGDVTDEVFSVRLPPAWDFGLDDLPGYDGRDRQVRLTTRLDVTEDARKRSVGYLGRAHPLVRRALERVRNLSFGGEARRGQDPRASVVKYDGGQHALLYTFLGRVSSQAGREFERVLAVMVPKEGEPDFLDAADRWMPLVDPDRAVVTTDVWEQQFAQWADGAGERAKQAAESGYRPIAEAYIGERRETLESERKDQHRWLEQRCEEITGQDVAPVQQLLFDEADDALGRRVPDWDTLEDPVERLAAFASDSTQHPAKRSEADGVLRIHEQRIKELEARLALSDPEVVPL